MPKLIKRLNGFFFHVHRKDIVKEESRKKELTIEEVIKRYEELCSR